MCPSDFTPRIGAPPSNQQSYTCGSILAIFLPGIDLEPTRVTFGKADAFERPKLPMQIEVEKTNGDVVIRLSGRLDINTSPKLRKAALRLYTKRKCKNLIVDFAEVSFIDTSGLATLVEILVTAKEQRSQLTLSAMKTKVRYLIDVNGLTGFFTIEDSAPEKLHA